MQLSCNKHIWGLFILACVLGLAACENDKDDLPSYVMNQMNLHGDWDLVITTSYVENGEVVEEATVEEVMKINADGSGSKPIFFGDQDHFRWYYQYHPAIIVIRFETYHPNRQQIVEFSIEANEQNYHRWYFIDVHPANPQEYFLTQWELFRK